VTSLAKFGAFASGRRHEGMNPPIGDITTEKAPEAIRAERA